MPQSDFALFLKDLKAILTLIKSLTNQIFIPITMTHSPLAADKDILVVLRTSANIDNVVLDGWFTPDINKLATKFVSKVIKLGKDEDDIAHKTHIYDQLKSLQEKEGLVIIGGFQDAKTSDLTCLFYKMDQASAGLPQYFIDIYKQTSGGTTGDNNDEGNIEEVVNQIHLDNFGYL